MVETGVVLLAENLQVYFSKTNEPLSLSPPASVSQAQFQESGYQYSLLDEVEQNQNRSGHVCDRVFFCHAAATRLYFRYIHKCFRCLT